MQCAPIPAHLVLGGISVDLCPVEVYERLLTCTVLSLAVDHTKDFLCAAVVGIRVSDPKPSHDIMAFVPPAPQGANGWAQTRMHWFFYGTSATSSGHMNSSSRASTSTGTGNAVRKSTTTLGNAASTTAAAHPCTGRRKETG